MKLVIVVEGGVVSKVISDSGEVDVLVLDRDVNGVLEDELIEVLGEKCTVNEVFDCADFSPEMVKQAFKEVSQ